MKPKTLCCREMQNNKIRFAYFLIAPLVLLVSLEMMHLTFPHAAEVAFQSNFYLQKMFLSYGFLLCWQGFFYLITQNAVAANICNSILMFLIAYASEVMGRINGNPLLPSNLLLVNNVKDIASFVELPYFPSLIPAVLLNLFSFGIHGFLLRTAPVKRRWHQRGGFGIAAFVMFLIINNTLCYDNDFRYRTLNKMDVQISAFNPIEDYQSSGAVLTFFPRIGDLVVPKPDTYYQNVISSFQSEYESNLPTPNQTKANVIIIQNEAWWNPSILPEVTYSTDLLSQIHSLSKNTVTGTFLSPVYAGGTCMPEFEVITGIPTYLLPSASYPYSQYITEQTPSIVAAYQDAGYQTVALHPYKTNFYNRSTAYPLLGFDTFKGMDEFTYQDKSGAYIDDMACAKQIIEEFEGKTSERIFEFVVTMENHGAYKIPRYESFDFEMEAPTLSEEDYLDLLRYSQGVYNADKAFMTLVDYFQEVDESVILVMYGDHLPLLGTNGSTYMDSGFVEHTDTFVSGNYPNLYETPYVVWTNYPIPDFDLQPKISGNTLGLKIFMESGCETPWYLSVFNELSNRYPAMVNTAIYNSDMEKTDTVLPEDEELLQTTNLLIYDILHGKQFCKR